jgi:hypothetical protein
VLLAVLLLLALAAWPRLATIRGGESHPPERAALMLFTSLPIFWAEAPDLASRLRDPPPPHWARRALEASHRLIPLDVLDEAALGPRKRLMMVQPRPLAPAENVALDAWVRGGGRLLLFTDPALTAASGFALGDRRRPQATALLSPLLAHWGLVLEFEPDQPPGERSVALGRARFPVNLPGRFAVSDVGGGCRLSDRALTANCTIGRGRVVAVADAALFDQPAAATDEQARTAALATLVGTLG